jgi:hypothetical protein
VNFIKDFNNKKKKMEFSFIFQILQFLVIIGIVLFVVGISIYFWIKNFKKVNKIVIKIICYIIKFLSASGVFIVFLIIFLSYLSEKKQDFFLNYLVNPKQFAYRQRILDKNDTMPKIKYVQSVDEIKDILNNRDFMEDLLRGLTQNDFPCVYSYHTINEKETINETLPHFMILNKKIDVFNDFTKNTLSFLKFFRIEESLISKFIVNKFGIDKIQGPLWFIFNANITGGSILQNEPVLKHSTLYNWNNYPDFLDYRLSVQIECVNAFFYKDKIYIEEAIFTFVGKLAFCIQDFLLDVERANSLKNNEII